MCSKFGCVLNYGKSGFHTTKIPAKVVFGRFWAIIIYGFSSSSTYI